MSFPTHRPRRLRRTEALRGLVRETRLSAAGLIYPMFVCPGTNMRKEVGSMPGVYQQSVDKIVEECREVEGAGPSRRDSFWAAGIERCARIEFDFGARRSTKGH